MNNKKIGFIGLGVMGQSMAQNLIRAGFSLLVYSRTERKAQPLCEQGAQWKSSPAELAKEADIVISMVGYPADVEEIYLGAAGVLQTAKAGTCCIDMTTSSPALAKKIAQKAAEKGIFSLDAPVSGGDVGARQGTLAIMVGGEEKIFSELLPVFEAMGKNICYFGAAGSGQFAKMSNQIAIASNMMGVCEALFYAKKCGLDPEKLRQTIAAGAAGSWSLNNLGTRMLQGDFAPGFFIKHFIKDMKIALESAKDMGIELPGLVQAKKLYDELQADGKENLGTQALLQWYEKQ